jgi:hypothetical protein
MSESERQYFIDPGVGNGNLLLLEALAGTTNTRVHKINGVMIQLAKVFHQTMTSSCDRSVDYVNAQTRESFPAKMLIWEMGLVSWFIFHTIPSDAKVIVSQDLLAQGIRMWWTGDLTLVTPDVFGKTGNWPKKLPPPNHILVWNEEARDRLKKRFGEAVKVQEFPIIPKIEKREKLPRYIFKMSGSGQPYEIIDQVIKRLEGGGTVLIDRTLKYLELLGDLNMPGQINLLIYPSESIMVLYELAKRGVRPNVVSLYPRGKHELENLIWAIQHDLVRTVCVPYRHQRFLKRLLDEAGLRSNQYWFVDPSEIHPDCFN